MEIRPARMSDVPELTQLIARSARELGRGHYTTEQIEAALGSAWGVDSQLIADGTYFVAELQGQVGGCGGWSWRQTLFGADTAGHRSAEKLDPARDAARIRAFFVDPGWARRGVAKGLLRHCEAELRRAGFARAALVATLPGVPFYRACGYEERERVHHKLQGGIVIEFVAMEKAFGS